MILELTQKQQTWQEEIRAFVNNEIVPIANQYDKEEVTPPELIMKMADHGYLGALLPQEYGGRGLDYVSLGILNEEVGRGCSSVRSLLTVHGMASLSILRWGNQEQKDRWLPKFATGELLGAFGLTEPNIGTDAKNIETTAVLSGDHYILNGKKKWITYGQIADLYLVFAQCEGRPTAFLVERNSPGFTTHPIKGVMGTRASMLAELHMDECRIPKENMLSRVGFGLTYVATNCLDYGRFTIASGCVGIGQACIDACLEYTASRIQFGLPIANHQLIKKMIAEMITNVKAARLLCHQASFLKDIAHPNSMKETWIAKYFASTMLAKITTDAIQIHGAYGCSEENSLQRYYRDSRVMEIIEGTTQMHEIIIADSMY
ncbi:acyl-CoA dehydrogenase [Brevibacillus antibioticus]|uniref:Acyl-CoA dehydrogenase n=1 Tax=Brevibacillus antibioticus TaxID=2570228 RepID=A0A4U2Y771_9BACL|nr:acyl-CoA dehydrogenase family protein [Brevibacillus antibioticus]TKI55061.1 acyl-CoA dehydrogenase [Brevibacillus antibioticus]